MISYGLNLSDGGRLSRMFEIISEVSCIFVCTFYHMPSLELTVNTNKTLGKESFSQNNLKEKFVHYKSQIYNAKIVKQAKSVENWMQKEHAFLPNIK